MPPILTFIIGLAILGLFTWYLTTEVGQRKRWLGLSLILILVAGALVSVYPAPVRRFKRVSTCKAVRNS